MEKILKNLYKTEGKCGRKEAKCKVSLSHTATQNPKEEVCTFFFDDITIMLSWTGGLNRRFIMRPISVFPMEKRKHG